MAASDAQPDPDASLEQQLDALLGEIEHAQADARVSAGEADVDAPGRSPDAAPLDEVPAAVAADAPPAINETAIDAAPAEHDVPDPLDELVDDAEADALASEVVDEQIEQAISEVEQAVQRSAQPDPTAAPQPTQTPLPAATGPGDALGGQIDQLLAPTPATEAAPEPPPAESAEPAADTESAERREVSIEDIDSLLADEADHNAGPEFQAVEDVIADRPATPADALPDNDATNNDAAERLDARTPPVTDAADAAEAADAENDVPETAAFSSPEEILAANDPADAAPAEALDDTSDTPTEEHVTAAADFAAPDDLEDDAPTEPAPDAAPEPAAAEPEPVSASHDDEPIDDEDDPDTPAPAGRFGRYLHAADRALGPAAHAATHAGPHVRRALALVNTPARRLSARNRETLAWIAMVIAGPGALLFFYGLLT